MTAPDALDMDPQLAERLRRTLAAVAATVPDDAAPVAALPAPAATASPTTRIRGTIRRLTAPVLAGAAALALAAFGYLNVGPEYVDKLPPDNVLQSGAADGDEFWLVPSFHTDPCGRPWPGVEVVTRSRNQVGQEWSTGGSAYGGDARRDARGCVLSVDMTGWLDRPGRVGVGYQRLGPDEDRSWLGTLSVHPTVVEVVVEIPGLPAARLATHALPADPAGPRYAAVVVPPTAARVTLALLDRNGRHVGRFDDELPRLSAN